MSQSNQSLTILITGSNGFIGSHVVKEFAKDPSVTLLQYSRDSSHEELDLMLAKAHVVIHLASVMRPGNEKEFDTVNVGLTRYIVDQLRSSRLKPLLLFTSSVHVSLDTAYAVSKRKAEQTIEEYCRDTGGSGLVYRLPNMFGPGARPHYTSVIATFCYNVAHSLPLEIHDGAKTIEFCHINTLIGSIAENVANHENIKGYKVIDNLKTYPVSLSNLAEKVSSFKEVDNLKNVSNFDKLLYETYLTYR